MNAIELKQRSYFRRVSGWMVLVGLLFLFYIGSSLVDSTKRYRQQGAAVEVACR